MIGAIETAYKGYRFRSRLEARWAVYFDALGVYWEYEKEGFHLPSGSYLPDFWLPQVQMWAEVKPEYFGYLEGLKCQELADLTQYPCLELEGTPDYRPYIIVFPRSFGDPSAYEFILTNEYVDTESRFWSDGGEDPRNWDDVVRAVTAARSARFEYGESPLDILEGNF